MTKKEAEALKEEIAKLREKVEALEKEPRKYEFHYHPPLFIPTVVSPPPPLPWYPWPWLGGTICANTQPSGISGTMAVNRFDAACCN